MRRSNEVRVDESWEARVCTRVLSTLMRQSNEVKVDESWEARVCARVLSTLMRQSNEVKVDESEKREFAREFSQLSCVSQTKWELMRVDYTGCYPVTQTVISFFILFLIFLFSIVNFALSYWACYYKVQTGNSHQLSWLVKRAKSLISSHQNWTSSNSMRVDQTGWELAVNGPFPLNNSTCRTEGAVQRDLRSFGKKFAYMATLWACYYKVQTGSNFASSALVTGQTRKKSQQLSSKFEAVQIRRELIRVDESWRSIVNVELYQVCGVFGCVRWPHLQSPKRRTRMLLTVLCYSNVVMDSPELRDRLPDIEMNIRTVGAGKMETGLIFNTHQH